MSYTSPYYTLDCLLLARNGHSEARAHHCVDYFTHDWNLADLAESWKMITRKKRRVLNGQRLENASWRVWAKRRSNLPTVSPESLNWLKDSDVTWLYGPLYTWEPDTTDPLVVQSVPTSPCRLKPALKRRSALDLLTQQRPVRSTPASPHVHPVGRAAKYSLAANPNCRSLPDLSSSLNRSPSDTSLASDSALERPRLRFNAKVEQCMAIAVDTHDDDDQDSEPGMGLKGRGATTRLASLDDNPLLVHLTRRRSQRRRRPTPHRTTIMRLEPTTLKAETADCAYHRLSLPWLWSTEPAAPSAPSTAAGPGMSWRSFFAWPLGTFRQLTGPLPVAMVGALEPNPIVDVALPTESLVGPGGDDSWDSGYPAIGGMGDDYSLADQLEDVLTNIHDIAAWCGSMVSNYTVF
ncbi:protein phosphatase regulator [Dimargaris xerosporica]|nr:protein phosphatase regulator [Dimargaris xerosporica]